MKQIYKPKQRADKPSIEYLRMSIGFTRVTQLIALSLGLLLISGAMFMVVLYDIITYGLSTYSLLLSLSLPVLTSIALYYIGSFYIGRKLEQRLKKHGLTEEDCFFYGKEK